MKNRIELPHTFNQFLTQADREYREQLMSLPLFDITKTSLWNKKQKKRFAEVFYHLRGHFVDFMWYVANFSSDVATKKLILGNIMEEFGKDKFSHEKLYAFFASECGVDIDDEIVNETNYLPFAKKFNKGHLAWLSTHDEEERTAAFAAYERLDNIDYPYLTACAESLNISSQGMTFFIVHSYVEHFSEVLEQLLPIWEYSPEKVRTAFDFIYSFQAQMWRQLSEEIFSLA